MIIIDMNLSPHWVETLARAGFQAEHWSAIGSPYATDSAILAHAKSGGHVILIHDLDFGTILAASGERRRCAERDSDSCT